MNTIKNYAHDYRGIAMSEENLTILLKNFTDDLISEYNANEKHSLDKEFIIRKQEKEFIQTLNDKLMALITSAYGEQKFKEENNKNIEEGRISAYNTATYEKLQNVTSFIIEKLCKVTDITIK